MLSQSPFPEHSFVHLLWELVWLSAANDSVTILVTKGAYDNFVALMARMGPTEGGR